MSIGGIVGTIEEMHNDRVVLLSSDPGVDGDDVAPTRLVLLRSAIARKVDSGPPSDSERTTRTPTTTGHPEDTEHRGGGRQGMSPPARTPSRRPRALIFSSGLRGRRRLRRPGRRAGGAMVAAARTRPGRRVLGRLQAGAQGLDGQT